LLRVQQDVIPATVFVARWKQAHSRRHRVAFDMHERAVVTHTAASDQPCATMQWVLLVDHDDALTVALELVHAIS
jgi:hypothetical protein